MTYSESDIAIVGMNCQYPGVHSVAAFETVLRTGCNILDPKVTPSNGHNHITLNNVYEHMAEFDANFWLQPCRSRNHGSTAARISDLCLGDV